MTISQAIQSAMSGLQATQTQAAIVSQNIANAQTQGYVRKDVKIWEIGSSMASAWASRFRASAVRWMNI